MIPYQGNEIFVSVLYFLVAKFIWFTVVYFHLTLTPMYKRQNFNLSSIPEKYELEEMADRDWVSKKKHDVLKAKYKCLKKLFQIYDATLIGILPESEELAAENTAEDEDDGRRRKKRSYLTKTDALVGTTETANGDIMTEQLESEKCSVTTSVTLGLNIKNSLTVTHIESDTKSNDSKDVKYASTQDSKENTSTVTNESHDSISSYPSTVRECPCASQNTKLNPSPAQQSIPNPYLLYNERRKPTRFQSFIHRILGLRPEKNYKPFMLPNGQICSFSENNIYNYRGEKRRRRRVRFRRFRRPKKVLSDGAMRDKSPVMLSYVQSIQRNFLMDTTPRQCPFGGCKMMFYGILNYNDHLNLCHLIDRKYFCHYCHEGFDNDYDKYVHENEHIGSIAKLNMASYFNLNGTCIINSENANSSTKTCDAQTEPTSKCEVADDKLKKIVSFFDKIVESQNSNQYFNEMKKQFSSESNMRSVINEQSCGCSKTSSDHGKRTISCTDTSQNSGTSDSERRDVTKCHFCGEVFDNRRQLNMHVNTEHRVHDKFSKFHSCVGIMRDNRKKKMASYNLDLSTESGKIQVESIYNSSNEVCESPFIDSDLTLSCDPSSNIVYFSSEDTINNGKQVTPERKPSIHSYKWKPVTKIIRV